MTGVDPAVDDGPDDPAPAGVVGAPGRVDLHGRRRTVDLGLQGVVRPDPEDDRGKPARPGRPGPGPPRPPAAASDSPPGPTGRGALPRRSWPLPTPVTQTEEAPA